MADNILDLALQITADPTQAQAAVGQFADKVQAAAQAIQAANEKAAASFTAEEQAILSAAGISEKAAQQEIEIASLMGQSREEYLALWQARIQAANAATQNAEASEREAAATADAVAETEAMVQALGVEMSERNDIGVRIGQQTEEVVAGSQTMGQAIRSNLGDLQALRRAFYSVFFFSGVAYLLPQLLKMGEEVATLAQQVGGYDAGFQQLMADAAKYNEKQIDAYRELSIVQQQTVNGIEDENRARMATAQFILANAKAALAAREAENAGLEQQVETIRTEDAVLREQYALFGAFFGTINDHLQGLADAQKRLDAGQEDQKKIATEIAKIQGDLQKAQQALTKEQEHGKTAVDKLAQAQQRWDEAIATGQAKLPPYIEEIDRLSKAIAQQESGASGTLQILKQYQEMLKGIDESPAKLGLAIDNSQAPISTQIQQVTQLSEAERDRLPTERELALANQELMREYPNLTNAERAEWAQVMLTSDAYRKHIDEAKTVHSTNAQLASSFNALAAQVRTAFSQMAGEITGWGGVATRVFDEVFNTITRQIEIEQRQAAEHQISQFSMAKATIDGLKQLAPVKAVVDTARGIEALASFDFAAAAGWFAAAALWGTVGAFQIASMVGAFSPGNSKSVSAAAATTSAAATGTPATPPPLASGTQSANAASGNQQHTIQVIFQGPVYGGKAATNEIISNINAAVSFDRAQLKASHTPTGRSLS